MTGSSRQGLAVPCLAKGQPPSHLERHFVRVHVVIAAVVHRGLEVDHRKAGQVAARRRLDNALFNGRNEIPRHRAAEDFVAKLEPAAARQRLHANLAVAKLPVAAGLLLVPSLRLGLAANVSRYGTLGAFR
jgi:hypothetical protein